MIYILYLILYSSHKNYLYFLPINILDSISLSRISFDGFNILLWLNLVTMHRVNHVKLRSWCHYNLYFNYELKYRMTVRWRGQNRTELFWRDWLVLRFNLLCVSSPLLTSSPFLAILDPFPYLSFWYPYPIYPPSLWITPWSTSPFDRALSNIFFSISIRVTFFWNMKIYSI